MSDKRLIEDFLPIKEISKDASREKSVRKGHICTLHLWWARRPLVACRAAVYASLVSAPSTKNGRGPKSSFIQSLCKYPADPHKVKDAVSHIYEAHAKRLSKELKKGITAEDIDEGKVPKPKILDMFAGGGAIPLEALRLGCDAYALELNPVAYLIELATLVYPQKFGKPDKTKKGCSEDGTWVGLAKEVEYWGKWVLEKTKEEIGDLYPVMKRGEFKREIQREFEGFVKKAKQQTLKFEDVLIPVAYLWTRTVQCKKPGCKATVPLVRQTWLCKKKGKFIAMKVEPDEKTKRPRFTIVTSNKKIEQEAIKEVGFDPADFSKGGNAVCIFCGTVCDTAYVKTEGRAKRIGRLLMVVVCTREGQRGKTYLSPDKIPDDFIPKDDLIWKRIEKVSKETGLNIPEESLPQSLDEQGDEQVTLGFRIQPYGYTKWYELFIPRQLFSLLTFIKYVRIAYKEILAKAYDEEIAKAILIYLGCWIDKVADYGGGLARWIPQTEASGPTLERHAIPMKWDSSELSPLAEAGSNAKSILNSIIDAINSCDNTTTVGQVTRGTATDLNYSNSFFDVIITDPPYYDNIPYADLSDFFYVWLKRSIGFLYPEHFSGELTPKKSEIVADAKRYTGKEKAKKAYEDMMFQSFKEAFRVLKNNAPMVTIYAHKTTAGWSTLVEALRKAGFVIIEAWPLETERPGRLREIGSSALASSIFLVAHKRQEKKIGYYENQVYPELEEIVKERVDTLWSLGITGADLLISSVGAGLKAYTQFEKVEFDNGKEVKSERFLQDVEGLVQEIISGKIFGISRKRVSGIDPTTRFYVLWRYTYGKAEIDAGEAIVFAYPQRIELDGSQGLSSGSNPLIEKKKNKYLLRDFTERGDDKKLGVPDGSTSAPLIDILHRLLYLYENSPLKINEFVNLSMLNTEHLRLVVQALVGVTFSGGQSLITTTSNEYQALSRLLTNWKNIIGGSELFRRR